MPSPRDQRAKSQPPGVCWPPCTNSTAPPTVVDARFGVGAVGAQGIHPGVTFASGAAKVPSLMMEASHGASSNLSTASTVFNFREDMATMQKQLAVLIEGQAELQASMLRISSDVSGVFTPLHGSQHSQQLNGSAKTMSRSPSKSQAQATQATSEKDMMGKERSDGRKSVKAMDEHHESAAALVKKESLERMFTIAEAAMNEQKSKRLSQKNSIRGKVTLFLAGDFADMTLDTIMAVVISINAIFIGVAMDYKTQHVGWILADIAFSAAFIAELSFKLYLHGVRKHFCTAQNAVVNCLDFLLIAIDFAQLLLELVGVSEMLGNAPSASLFRVVRLLKITRVLRLIKTDVFKDLLDMIQGIIGGLSTLMWSMVFFVVIVYVAALLFRETIGRVVSAPVHVWFDSVARSMFSTFRCSFGDCSTGSGTPIFEHVQEELGWIYSLVYCLFLFSVTVGLFNVISAIFVESTMAAASKLELAKKRSRLADEKLLALRVTQLIQCMLRHSEHGDAFDNVSLTQAVETLFHIEVPRSVIDETIHDPDAIEALDDLDINPQDRARLSDIFDPDNGGTVQLSDVAAGIRRLRGDPRRSDIVCVDLMIRALQAQADTIKDILEHHFGPVPEDVQ
eukprot:TRINITY_DN107670_c0_g1_i1.p1 TRINITY_DN107670_c0_g1~~TRINITY_DN107670_c0_g1_i1.p1  ORF type:complete len:623 (+),score=98.27 TRINITY_DN107670_c0_g1_i1:43-1911(+)